MVSDSTSPSAIQNIKVGVRIRNIPTWHGRSPTTTTPGKLGTLSPTPTGTSTPKLSTTTTSASTSNLVTSAVNAISTSNTNLGIVNDTTSIITTTNTTVTITHPTNTRPQKDYNFDYVFGMDDGQDRVYEAMVRPLIDRCMDGYNGCIFVYGQTASGKTYTMQGPSPKPSTTNTMSSDFGKNKGIIYRVADQVMDYARRVAEGGRGVDKIDVSITASYLEIYQEQLRDLLCDDEAQGDLRIRIDPNSIVGTDLYVQGLTHRHLVTPSDFTKLLQTGTKRRTVGETNMNEVSSRSHSVLTLVVEQYQVVGRGGSGAGDGGDDVGAKKRSKIHLIDLAGSERADATGATGTRLKEGSSINQSLSSLGNVINALTTSSPHIPYRDSKLTYLLSDSLGGNALTAIIACVTPVASAYDESVSTLRFAERAKKVVNRARVNMDPMGLRIMALEAEVARLRGLLARCRCGASNGLGIKMTPKDRIMMIWKSIQRPFTSCFSCTQVHAIQPNSTITPGIKNHVIDTTKPGDSTPINKSKVMHCEDVPDDTSVSSTFNLSQSLSPTKPDKSMNNLNSSTKPDKSMGNLNASGMGSNVSVNAGLPPIGVSGSRRVSVSGAAGQPGSRDTSRPTTRSGRPPQPQMVSSARR